MDILSLILIYYIIGCFSSLILWIITYYIFYKKELDEDAEIPKNTTCLVTISSWVGFMIMLLFNIDMIKFKINKWINKKNDKLL
jgi:energy-coupling factor transporter transmembrane protein EcfT